MDNKTSGIRCSCSTRLFGHESLKEVNEKYVTEKENDIWKRHEYLKLLIFKHPDLVTEEAKVKMCITIRFALVKVLDYV